MRLTITPAEMKRVETRVMNETAVTGEMLMQRAAAHVAAAVRRRAQPGVVWCVCAAGNNGGDGLAAMRMLANADDAFAGEVWLAEGTLSPDARRELGRLEACAGAARVRVRLLTGGSLPPAPQNVGCIIDALFGTGLSRPLAGVPLALCRLINASGEGGVPVVAVDIPSGLNGDTGEVMGETVRADETVTFHRPKPGLYLREGPDYAGRVTVADIGIPAAVDDAAGLRLLEETDLAGLLPARRRVSHKGSYGRVLLWAGSPGMAGAAAICATATLRAGAGLVTVACPEAVMPVVQTLCPCATCLSLPMEDAEAAWALLKSALERADALGAGCGLGQGEAAAELFERLLGWLGAHERRMGRGRAEPACAQAGAPERRHARAHAPSGGGGAPAGYDGAGGGGGRAACGTPDLEALWRGGCAQGHSQRAVRSAGPGAKRFRHPRDGQGRQRRRAHRRSGGAAGGPGRRGLPHGRPDAFAGCVRLARAGRGEGGKAVWRARRAGDGPVRIFGLYARERARLWQGMRRNAGRDGGSPEAACAVGPHGYGNGGA